MTPGFIDLSFVNRGYEKTEPLVLPKSYEHSFFFRNLAERVIDDIDTPFNIYSGRFSDDYTTMMEQMMNKYEQTNAVTRMYLRQLQKGELRTQEDTAIINNEATPEEITTNSLTANLAPGQEAMMTPGTNNQSSI